MSSNGGDCEDYSIAKYFLLKEAGIPIERLRITYVKAVKLNQAHMVLAYYAAPGAEPLILDNLETACARRPTAPTWSPCTASTTRRRARARLPQINPRQIRAWRDLLAKLERNPGYDPWTPAPHRAVHHFRAAGARDRGHLRAQLAHVPQQQLDAHAQETATSLALSLGQGMKAPDPRLPDLHQSGFRSRPFRFNPVLGVDGKPLVSRRARAVGDTKCRRVQARTPIRCPHERRW